ncbi:AfsR family transcriptional regulator [Streptacidiphilus sp. PB12-B1b]|nr:AfsR family transcriptional regulator [Streptacidiphilus sp. PB12-B1b]
MVEPAEAAAVAPAPVLAPAAAASPAPVSVLGGGWEWCVGDSLPGDLVDFTGRGRELGEVLRCVGEGAGGGGVRVVALDGMGGCGKTSLAVRVAHVLAGGFPDGRLYVDMRGYTPGEPVVSAFAALGVLLGLVGVPGDRVPEDLAGRSALWRGLLVGRRVLLLVDNVADAGGIVPLLPGSGECVVLVTSRARLVDLDGARWVSVGVMEPGDSVGLVVEMLGEKRVLGEVEAVGELVGLCGHLPLALRIAAARLRNRPRWTVRYLVDRLRDETRRLDELSLGVRSVGATLRLSYQALDEECRSAFRLLALHPGGVVDVFSAGALLGVASRDAEDLLELLLDVHLVQQPELGLYAFHDLVRSFALGLARESGVDEVSGAVERLLGFYLTATEVACEVLFPDRARRVTGIEPSTAELPVLGAGGGARLWFDRELGALVSAVSLAQRRGLDRFVVCLVRNVVFQLHARGRLEEFAEVARVGVVAARRLGDLELLGVSLSNLAVACWSLGRFADGVEAAREGREVAACLGDRYTVAYSDATLGQFNSLLGCFPVALEHLERAVSAQRELGAVRALADSLTLLSTLFEQWGRFGLARVAAGEAVELHAGSGRRGSELVALTDLAFACVGLGELGVALECVERAGVLCDGGEDPRNVALVLALGVDVRDRLRARDGEPAAAGTDTDAADGGGLGEMARALELVRSGSSALRRAKVENMAGRVLRRRGRFGEALELHGSALEAASGIEYRIEVAYALAGMAAAQEGLGNSGQAEAHRAAAEELFTAMGVPPESRRD